LGKLLISKTALSEKGLLWKRNVQSAKNLTPLLTLNPSTAAVLARRRAAKSSPVKRSFFCLETLTKRTQGILTKNLLSKNPSKNSYGQSW